MLYIFMKTEQKINFSMKGPDRLSKNKVLKAQFQLKPKKDAAGKASKIENIKNTKKIRIVPL